MLMLPCHEFYQCVQGFHICVFTFTHTCICIYTYGDNLARYAKIMILSMALMYFLWLPLLYGWRVKHPNTQWLKTRAAFILLTNLQFEPGRYSSSLLHVVSAGAAHGLLRGRWQKENCLYELAWKSSAVTSVAAIHQEGHGVPCTFKGGGDRLYLLMKRGKVVKACVGWKTSLWPFFWNIITIVTFPFLLSDAYE